MAQTHEPLRQMVLIEGVQRPRKPKVCAVCGQTVERRWRCQDCWKLVCDNCGGENQDGDWFCNPCWDNPDDGWEVGDDGADA